MVNIEQYLSIKYFTLELYILLRKISVSIF